MPDGSIIGQINVEGCDGNIGIRDSLKIRIPSFIKDQLSASNPIVLLPSRVYFFYDCIAVKSPSSLLRDLIGFDLLLIEVGDVDIQKGILWKSFLRNILCDPHSKACGCLKFEVAP